MNKKISDLEYSEDLKMEKILEVTEINVAVLDSFPPQLSINERFWSCINSGLV